MFFTVHFVHLEETMSRAPAYTCRIGNIQGTVWDNESQGTTWYNTKIVRCYKVEGNWQDAPDYRSSDLPVVVEVARRCLDWIINAEAGFAHRPPS